jgi:predicted SnoaL-like aldol condensation-catalyzing enzyme
VQARTTQSSDLEKNKQVIRNYIEEVFNRHDLAAMDKYTTGAESVKQYLESVKQYLGEYFAGHPDSHTTIDQIVAEGDKVFVLLNTTTTSKQTGKEVTIKSADVYKIASDMIVENWNVVEVSTLPNRKISEL